MSTYLNKNIKLVRRDNLTTPDWSEISLTLKLPLTNSKDSIEPKVQIVLISFSIESLKISFLLLFKQVFMCHFDIKTIFQMSGFFHSSLFRL